MYVMCSVYSVLSLKPLLAVRMCMWVPVCWCGCVSTKSLRRQSKRSIDALNKNMTTSHRRHLVNHWIRQNWIRLLFWIKPKDQEEAIAYGYDVPVIRQQYKARLYQFTKWFISCRDGCLFFIRCGLRPTTKEW